VGPAPPSLPRGAQAATLAGNPQSPGLFTLRLRFPPGYAVPPHSHPGDEYVTVISGQVSIGMDPRMNRARAARLVAGGFIHAPARMNHYAFTRTGAVVPGHRPRIVRGYLRQSGGRSASPQIRAGGDKNPR